VNLAPLLFQELFGSHWMERVWWKWLKEPEVRYQVWALDSGFEAELSRKYFLVAKVASELALQVEEKHMGE
jgi:hypothetical protein